LIFCSSICICTRFSLISSFIFSIWTFTHECGKITPWLSYGKCICRRSI
jgi:hypothetical protein